MRCCVLLLTVWSVLAAPCALPQEVADDESPVARILCFVSETCPECQAVKEGVLRDLQDGYGPQLDVKFFEIDDSENA